jgi:nucleotidyltransferase substrate binding protein (TIGR01987 family)
MDRAALRNQAATRALLALAEVAGIATPTAIERDAAIQRFEFTFEAVWKSVQEALRSREGLDAASPKAAIRHSVVVGWLTPDEGAAALQMADDRNLTSHTYNEALAQAIHARIEGHADLLARWLARSG